MLVSQEFPINSFQLQIQNSLVIKKQKDEERTEHKRKTISSLSFPYFCKQFHLNI